MRPSNALVLVNIRRGLVTFADTGVVLGESIVMPAAGLKNCRVSRLSPNNPY